MGYKGIIYMKTFLINLTTFCILASVLSAQYSENKPYSAYNEIVELSLESLSSRDKDFLLSSLVFDRFYHLDIEASHELIEKAMQETKVTESKSFHFILVYDLGSRLFNALSTDEKIWMLRVVEALKESNYTKSDQTEPVTLLNVAKSIQSQVRFQELPLNVIFVGSKESIENNSIKFQAKAFSFYEMIQCSCWPFGSVPNVYLSYPNIVIEGLVKGITPQKQRIDDDWLSDLKKEK